MAQGKYLSLEEARKQMGRMIRVWSFQRSRIVKIVSSGKCTREPENVTPHWRHSGKRAGNMDASGS